MDDETDRQFLEHLQRLIGRNCSYLGKRCLVIDILPDEGTLVLESWEQLPPIQTDQYGQATSRSNELLQIPILAGDGTAFSDEIIDLFASLTDSGRSDNQVQS